MIILAIATISVMESATDSVTMLTISLTWEIVAWIQFMPTFVLQRTIGWTKKISASAMKIIRNIQLLQVRSLI